MVRLLKDNVMVECDDEGGLKQTPAGIILPESKDDAREKKMPTQGIVVAVGPGVEWEGKLMPVGIAVGARVIFDRYNHKEVQVPQDDGGSKRCFVMREEHVLAELVG